MLKVLEFIYLSDGNMPIYKDKTGKLYCDVNIGEGKPELYTCTETIYHEPGFPIKKDFKIKFINQYKVNPYRFEYMMLDRLRSDCDYFLGYGNRSKKRLCNENVQDHINEMKRIYNILPEKPQWLTFDKILEYEQKMSKEC